MALEIVSRRILTDREIRVIQEQDRVNRLLDEIRDDVSYSNRDNPAFSASSLTRRRLLEIAGLSTASLLICSGFSMPARGAGADLGTLATLIARWNTRQPQLQSANVAISSEIVAKAPAVSTVSYPQPSHTVAFQLEDSNGVLENSTTEEISLDAYEEIIIRYAFQLARTIPPGRKRLLFYTKIARILATLHVSDA